jgi:hypothetical protein
MGNLPKPMAVVKKKIFSFCNPISVARTGAAEAGWFANRHYLVSVTEN